NAERNVAEAERARHVKKITARLVGRKDVEDERHGPPHLLGRVAVRMRHAGVASLREDGLVIFDHAEARDLGGDERFVISDRYRFSAFAVAQHRAHATDDLLRPRADGTDRVDFPRLLPLARELDDVLAVRAMHAPAARFERLDDAVVELDRDVAEEGDRVAGAELAQEDVEEFGVRGADVRRALEDAVVVELRREPYF